MDSDRLRPLTEFRFQFSLWLSQRERERQTDRQTDRDRERVKERHRDTETDTETERYRQTDRQTDRQTERENVSRLFSGTYPPETVITSTSEPKMHPH